LLSQPELDFILPAFDDVAHAEMPLWMFVRIFGGYQAFRYPKKRSFSRPIFKEDCNRRRFPALDGQ
jgi:hypothetical protein